MALSPTGALWGIDPNIAAPHVHQVSVGIQREIGWATAVEARYVGTFGREHLARHRLQPGADQPGLPRRLQSRAVERISCAAGRTRLSARSSIRRCRAASPLTVLPSFGAALLTNANVVSQPADEPGRRACRLLHEPAAWPGPLATFMQNPGIYASQGLANGGFSDYNSLQLELRRRFRNGFFGQLNYTLLRYEHRFSRHCAEPLRGVHGQRPPGAQHRPLGVSRHTCRNANAIYELPFGSDRDGSTRTASSTRSSAAGRWLDLRLVRAARQSASPRHAAPSTAPAAQTAPAEPDQLQHRVQHAVGRRNQGPARRPQASRTGRSSGSIRRSSTRSPAAPSAPTT